MSHRSAKDRFVRQRSLLNDTKNGHAHANQQSNFNAKAQCGQQRNAEHEAVGAVDEPKLASSSEINEI